MLEDARKQAAKDLAIAARQALRGTYALPPGEWLSIGEKALVDAMAKLIKSVERLAEDGGQYPLAFLEQPDDPVDETQSLEEIYESVTGKGAPSKAQKFVVHFGEVELDIDEIWPEGDAPDDPTPDDVVEAMKQVQYAHPLHVAKEWNLIDTLYVRCHNDEDTEVEWDGS